MAGRSATLTATLSLYAMDLAEQRIDVNCIAPGYIMPTSRAR